MAARPDQRLRTSRPFIVSRCARARITTIVVLAVALLLTVAGRSIVRAADGNRYAHLVQNDPWYPHTWFPRLTTPQWVGEENVDAVVVLAIDDMRDPEKYEAYLRPILQRLKAIDGRAPVSIMSCNLKPDDPQLQSWLSEGLSIEVHTVDHPCPLLNSNDLAKAKSTYDRCVDLMSSIPNNKPVAFRTPCCDSLNTVSPRFFSEIFNKTTPEGRYLSLSSSVFNVFTSADPDIPRELVIDEQGQERFRQYFPKGLKRGDTEHNNFVNWIENYPYPYVINGLCWEFPCMVPSDWEAQFRQQPNNPQTVRDMQTALDITVSKQGVYCLVFHPHGWIKSEQVVELIDHAVAKHGSRVKFLTFREAQERIDRNLLAGQPLRSTTGGDNGVRVLDVDDDGYMDVVTGNDQVQTTRLWRPQARSWKLVPFPSRIDSETQFTVVRTDHRVSVMSGSNYSAPATAAQDGTRDGSDDGRLRHRGWYYDGQEWRLDEVLQNLLQGAAQSRRQPIEVEEGRTTAIPGPETPRWHFRDINHDGRCEAIVVWQSPHGNRDLRRPDVNVFLRPDPPPRPSRSSRAKPAEVDLNGWISRRFAWPAGSIEPASGVDPALFQFVDLNEDGFDDLLSSTEQGVCVCLFDDRDSGWAVKVINEPAVPIATTRRLPPIILNDGSHNGFFVHGRYLCWQNESTDALPDLIHRVSFDELLRPRRLEQGAVSPVKQPDAADDPLDFPLSKTPREALATLKTRPGLKVELVASEPLIRDPVAFEWDVKGRLWVVEMGGYPNGTTAPGSGELQSSDPLTNGRVRLLTDTDHDGVYDAATTFLDQLNFPTGIQRWLNGVLITAAPDIIYAEDTDGDGVANIRHVVYRGFVEGNQQHRVNGLRPGLDNWLYLANGDSGGDIAAVGYLVPDSVTSGETDGTADSQQRFVKFADQAGQPLNIRGRDLRIDPYTGRIEAVSGQAQFGRERDDTGNWFGCNNSRPMWHYVLDDRHLRRNPHAPVRDTRVEVPEIPGAAPVYPASRTLGRFNDHDRANRFTSACSTMIYRDDAVGEEFYGDAFTCEPVHNLVSRLVLSSEGVSFRGRRSQSEERSEFLTSTDNWFRPVMIRTGPDGALWVADMYRFVIEHPEWIPPEWQQKLDLRAGDRMGRIYRIVRDTNTACCAEGGRSSNNAPSNEAEATAKLDPMSDDTARPQPLDGLAADRDWIDMPEDQLSIENLIGRLSSRNGWWRDTAQRLLVSRIHALNNVTSATDKPVADVVTEVTSLRHRLIEVAAGDASPLARLHAMSLLPLVEEAADRCQARPNGDDAAAGQRALQFITSRLQDGNPTVRRHALRLLNDLLVNGPAVAADPSADVSEAAILRTLDAVLTLVDDDNSAIQLELATTLGAFPPSCAAQAGDALGRLAIRHETDPWVSAAVCSSLNSENVGAALHHVLTAGEAGNAGGQSASSVLIGRLIAQQAAFRLQQIDTIVPVLKQRLTLLHGKSTEPNASTASDPEVTTARLQSVNVILRELRRHTAAWSRVRSSEQMKSDWDAVTDRGLLLAEDGSLPETVRHAAVELVGLASEYRSTGSVANEPSSLLRLAALINPRSSTQLQLAAVESLAATGRDDAAAMLLLNWKSLTPGVRQTVVDRFIERQEWCGILLGRIGSDVQPSELDASQRERLLTHSSAAIRETATRLLGDVSGSTRADVVAAHQSALQLPGAIERGRLVFEKRCAACHKLDGLGRSIGADLAALRDRSGTALLTAILDPNRAVEAKFLSYTAVTDEGRSISGMLLSETSSSITLISTDGKEHLLARGSIDTLVSSNRSLMPEGLEKDLSDQDLADVIAFVQSAGVAAKSVAGNLPHTVTMDDDGSLTLPATAASIYGPSLTLEDHFKNLGWWQSELDHAAWTIELATPGRFEVVMDYACHRSAAGDQLELQAGDQKLAGRVPSTDRWDRYGTWLMGRIDLPAGTHRIVVSTPVKPRSALIDLRSIRLRVLP